MDGRGGELRALSERSVSSRMSYEQLSPCKHEPKVSSVVETPTTQYCDSFRYRWSFGIKKVSFYLPRYVFLLRTGLCRSLELCRRILA